MTVHIMLDLETMGVDSDAAIVAIGACKFECAIIKDAMFTSAADAKITDTFYAPVDLQSSMEYGGTLTASTIKWWMQQEEAARKEVHYVGGYDIYSALRNFSTWLSEDFDTIRMWGNGVAFDNVILSNAYKSAKLQRPWPFWGDMCYRTARASHRGIVADPFVGTPHNALDDAVHQAKHLMKIVRNGSMRLE